MTQQQLPDDVQRARDEYRRLLRDYDFGRFLTSCNAHAARVIENARDGASYIAGRALHSLATAAPFMLVRIGDAEANLLRYAADPTDFEKQWVDAVFRMNDDQALAAGDALLIARELQGLLGEADVIGLRPFCPAPLEQHLAAIGQTIDSGDLRGAFGMIGAFTQAEQAASGGAYRHAVLTSAWVHLTLLDHMERLLAEAPRVIVISGRRELSGPFAARLGSRLAQFLTIPLQASDQPLSGREYHYPQRYREIVAALHGDLRGTLVLVGAGILGKQYCAVARQHGGVALDLGSAFDLLAGQRTRPVHSIASFVDPGRTDWLAAAGR